MDGYRVLEWDAPRDVEPVAVPERFNMATLLVDRHLAEGHGERVAVYYRDEQVSYWDLAALVNRIGNALYSLGLGLGDRIVLLLPDCPQFLATFLGAMKIGAVPVPINTLASVDDLHYYLGDSRARAVVVAQDLLEKLAAVRDRLPHLRHVVVVGDPADNAWSFTDVLAGRSVELAPTDTH